jgi:DNA-binding XRE family transcriptional regulator
MAGDDGASPSGDKEQRDRREFWLELGGGGAGMIRGMKKPHSKRSDSNPPPSGPRPSSIPTGLPAPACYVVADILRQVRLKLGLSLSEAGKLSGVSDSMIAFIEKKEAVPTLDKVFRLLDAYRIQMVLVAGNTQYRL